MVLQKKDFIEIEFTGREKGGDIFDSNIKEDLKKANLNTEAKPFVFCLGENMFLQALDEHLIGKDLGKYEIELEPVVEEIPNEEGSKEKSETSEEIVEDIEKSGVPEKVAEKEEKLDEIKQENSGEDKNE